MSSVSDRAALRNTFISLFPLEPIPSSILLTAGQPNAIEHDILELFQGKRWSSVNAGDWRMVGVPMSVIKSYVVADSFRYYLPSLIVGSFADPSAVSLALEAILPPNQQLVPRGPWWAAFWAGLLPAQRRAMAAFAKLALEDSPPGTENQSLADAALAVYDTK